MGITQLTVPVGGTSKNLNVYGDNGTGKSTIYHALSWLLFGKNSECKEQFEIKPLDKDNKPLHNLDYEVSGEFDLNGKRITLRRVLKEVWGKERQTKGTFKHETEYFIDDIPVTATQYDAFINDICPESRFWMLSSADYFNTQLHWTKRREILLEVCGDVSDEDVIASDRSLADLPDILQGRSLDDHRKLVGVKSKEVKQRLGLIPSLINEATRALTEVPESPIDVEPLEERIDEIRAQGQALTSGGRAAELMAQISQCDADLIARTNELSRSRNDVFEGNLHIVREKRAALNELEGNLAQLEREVKGQRFLIEEHDQRLEGLRKDDDEISASEFVWSGLETCSACGQALPHGQVADTKAEQEAAFNLRKSERLEQLLAIGSQLAAEVAEAKGSLAAKEEAIKNLVENLIPTAKDELDAAKTQADATTVPAVDPESDPVSMEIAARKAQLTKERQDVIAGNQTAIDELTTKIEAAKARLKDANETNAAIAANAATQTRIAQLTDEETQLSRESERLERELYLIEEFIRVKVRLLESRINAKFNVVGFKLFKEQINGGLAECCVCTVNGVPYDGALNHGARVNAGLDIVKALQHHYGFFPPVVIDGAESTTSYLQMGCQLIRLYVSEADKQLRFA